jgi:hypothetical protein
LSFRQNVKNTYSLLVVYKYSKFTFNISLLENNSLYFSCSICGLAFNKKEVVIDADGIFSKIYDE